MATLFATLPSYEPDWVVPPGGGPARDPYILMDEVSTGSASDRRALANNIDWLPQTLKDMVDAHRPQDGDIDSNGIVNKERLTEEAEKLFGKAKTTMTFVNFYQLRQFALRFAGYWGFHLVTNGNTILSCFFGESSTKKHVSIVPPERQRQRTSVKCGCNFRVNATLHPQNKGERHRTPVRITNLSLKHDGTQCNPGLHCNPGLPKQPTAKKPRTSGPNTRVTRQKMMEACQTLAEFAMNAEAEKTKAIYRAVIQLQDIVRPKLTASDAADQVVKTARQATGS